VRQNNTAVGDQKALKNKNKDAGSKQCVFNKHGREIRENMDKQK